METSHEGRPVVEFADTAELESWLRREHASTDGVWVRLRKSRSTVPSVSFHDLLEAGIAHGWSESTRHALDADSYLQRFGPRRSRGTASERNRAIARRLLDEGRLTPAGLRALGWDAAVRDAANGPGVPSGADEGAGPARAAERP